jgi:hypothetical protein
MQMKENRLHTTAKELMEERRSRTCGMDQVWVNEERRNKIWTQVMELKLWNDTHGWKHSSHS